jgi:phenylpropionate dioxygenase-like ring-hydroxylating dioxygenase large terminal subunit
MAASSYDYLQGFQVTPDVPPDHVDAKAPYIDHGTQPIDTSRYFSRQYMAREWDELWTTIWVLAGVSSDLSEPGDFFTFDLRHESILIVKGDDHKIRGFYNVCAHRGLRLVQSEVGSVSAAFTCPYHGWAYHLDGENAKIVDRETFRPEVLCHKLGLTELKCEIFGGLVYVSMSDNPPPLEEFLGEFGKQILAYRIDEMVVIRHFRAELGANWKGGVDGFLEGYHFHSIHPQVLAIVDDYHVQQDMYPNGMSRLIVPQVTPSPRLADRERMTDTFRSVMIDSALDPETLSARVTEARYLAPAAKRKRAEAMNVDVTGLTDAQLTDSYVYGCFPNAIMGAHLEAVIIHRFLPHADDPDRLYFDTMTLYRPVENSDGTYAIPAWMGFGEDTDLSGESRPDVEIYPLNEYRGIGLVLEQDAEMIPLAHAGQRSRGFRGALLGEQEQRIRHFHAELDKYIPPMPTNC